MKMKMKFRNVKYKKRNINVLSINTAMLLLSVLFLLIGSHIQNKDFFMGSLINEVFFILLPAIILGLTGKFRVVLSIRHISIKNILRVIVIMLLCYPIILLINGLFLTLFSNFTEFNNFSMKIVNGSSNIQRYLIFMCLVPAICEELLFRGALLNAYDIYGAKISILFSAFVFAIFHFDIQNFIAPLLLGIVFGNLLNLTGSIFACIVAHFTNNVIALISSRYINDTLFLYLEKTNLAQDIGSVQLYIITLLIIISVISCVLLKYIYSKMKYEKRKIDNIFEIKHRTREIRSVDLFNFVPIIAMIILYFIYYKIVYY